MIRISIVLIVSAVFAGTFSNADEDKPGKDKSVKKAVAAPYDGFTADQALLRKHLVHKAKDGGKDTKGSSGEACEGAVRIFTRVPFLFRTRDEVLHRAAHEHFVGTCERADTRRDVHGDAADVFTDDLDLATMQPDANGQLDRGRRVADREGAADRLCGTVEGGEEAVAQRLHLDTTATRELGTDHLMVAREQLAPPGVAEVRCPLRGAHDVGEEHGGETTVRFNAFVDRHPEPAPSIP